MHGYPPKLLLFRYIGINNFFIRICLTIIRKTFILYNSINNNIRIYDFFIVVVLKKHVLYNFF